MRKTNSSLSSKWIQKVSKFIVCTLSFLILVGCSSTVKNEQEKVVKEKNKSTNIEESKTNLSVNEDEIIKTIKDISLEKRVLGTEGEKKAARYLKDKMENFGYNVEYQDFEVFKISEKEKDLMHNQDINVFLDINPLKSTESKGVARNVIVKPKNFDKNKKTLYLISHYDTTENTTGVYDNATGVSTVTEVARVLSKYDFKDFNVAYVYFSAEEYFKMGSRYFISQLSDEEKENILGAINVDMVGYTGFEFKDAPNIGNPEILLNYWVKKDALETLVNKQFKNKYNVDNEKGGMSDDISFARLGVPTLYFADKEFSTGYEIEGLSMEKQLEPVKSKIIADLSKDILDFIKNLNLDEFNELNSIPEKEKGTFENSL